MGLNYSGIFLGLGSNNDVLAFSSGFVLKPFYKLRLNPYYLGIYGYTGAIRIKNASHYNKTDYGFSDGTGIEFNTKNLNAWLLGVVLPFRSKEFRDHYQYLKDHPNIELKNNLKPIAISIGYKMIVKAKTQFKQHSSHSSSSQEQSSSKHKLNIIHLILGN